MSEPKRYKSAKECWLKFLSNVVSFKYQCGIIVTIAFFMGTIPWFAWLPSIMAIGAIRGWERFLLFAPRQLTEEPHGTAPEAME